MRLTSTTEATILLLPGPELSLNMKVKKILLLFLPAVITASVAAADPKSPADTGHAISPETVIAAPGTAPDIWSYSDCVEWATANATEVRRNLLDILISEQDVASAKDAWLPSVGFSTNQSFTNYPAPGESRSANIYGSNYGINADWTVWDGNLRKYRLESARLVLEQQRLAGEDLQQTLKLGLLQAYMQILYAKEAVGIAERTLQVSDTTCYRAKRLYESGRISKVDYAQMESQKAQDEYNLVQASNNLEQARLDLKKILQLRVPESIRVKDVKFEDSAVLAPLPDKETVYLAAAAWLPSFKSNSLSKDIYAADIKAAQSKRLPSISLNGGIGTGHTSGDCSWGYNMSHNFNENIGLTLSVPIFDANSTKRAVAKAKLNALDFELTEKSLLDDLSQTVESLYIDASNAQARFQAGIAQLDATRLTYELTNRQLELGLVNPLELLTARNNFLKAQLEQLQNKYKAILAAKTINYYFSSIIEL